MTGARRIESKTVKRSVGQSPFREETVGASLGLLCHTAALESPAMSRTFPALREKKRDRQRRENPAGGPVTWVVPRKEKPFVPTTSCKGRGERAFLFCLPGEGFPGSGHKQMWKGRNRQMKWTGLNELREKYLSFFESKGHTRLPSASLVPQGDKSLLLINSGMAPLKKFFTGAQTPPNTRVTTCQKCVRTPDIENVGKTARHGTYFEMLGNFSFGDYFKEDATAWAWEFVTQVLEMPVDKLYISVYEDDDEAYEIWTKHRGVAPDHMVRLGKEDNFWEHGTGPCGPCSEIYFDRGVEHGCGKPTCSVGCDCDRFVEFWNLVFTQFDSDGNGNYARLDHPNIDTGMGLERLACIMQGVENIFEVDTVQNIMKKISQIAGVSYGESEKTDISLRVITDHVRSTVFMVGDGVVPQNEGRGYVLRRLLRRGARHGRLLGIHRPFLYEVAETVIQENEAAYPELREKEAYIKQVIRMEEERFSKNIEQGMELLNGMLDKMATAEIGNAQAKFSGEDAFKLYDTFGFPIDLTKEIIGEQGIDVDEERFAVLMNQQRERARAARNKNDNEAWADELSELVMGLRTEFAGYTHSSCPGNILSLLRDGEQIETAEAGDSVGIVLDKTVFYTTSGGQVSDTGVITTATGSVRVHDCKKVGDCVVHLGEVTEGTVESGQNATSAYDFARREAIRRNHTAAHLTQAALRKVLGDHVHQAGSEVDENRMRFDFSHFSAVTPEELSQVENLVNEMIFAAVPVITHEMPLEEAKKLGAMALFGEKYGDIVRVVEAQGYSVEFCGGTHVDNTAKLGLFKIVSESSVAAGVRRIEAVTGSGVLKLVNGMKQILNQCADAMKLSSPEELLTRSLHMLNELKEKDRKIAQLSEKMASMQMNSVLDQAIEIGGVRFMSATLSNVNVDTLRSMGDQIKGNHSDVVAALASIEDGKGKILVVCGKDALAKGLHAGKLVKEIAALAGGNGGGRPDSAMAGVPNIFQIDEALAQAPSIIGKMVGIQ